MTDSAELNAAIRKLCESEIHLRVANYRLAAAQDGRMADPEAEARITQLGFSLLGAVLRGLGDWADARARQAGADARPPRPRRGRGPIPIGGRVVD